MFEVGKEVICIKSHSGGAYIKGNKYPVDAIRKGCQHHPILLDIGLDLEGLSGSECRKCNTAFMGTRWASGKYFAPIDNTLSETTIEQLLNEPETVEI